jgi:hypothetical protein
MKPKKDQRPIVCGTDFSDTAIEAVDIAAAMGRRLEHEITGCSLVQTQKQRALRT